VSGALRTLAAAAVLLAGTPAFAAKKAPLGPADRIDLNRASATELTRLPGIGEKRALAIVAARTRQPFRKLEDVLAVKGIGPAWLAKVRANVVVGPVASTAGPSAAATPTTGHLIPANTRKTVSASSIAAP
jgi:competence protein ComEA